MTGAGLVAATAYVAARNPAQGGFPPCPFHAATGLWCPGCGLTRAVHSLAHADIARAFGHNALFPLVLGAVAVAWLSSYRIATGRSAIAWPARLPRSAWVTMALGVAAFTVARNTAAFHALAP